MPDSTKDRFTVDFEKVFFFTKNQKYWFEQQLEECAECSFQRINQKTFEKQHGGPKDYGLGTNPNRSARKALENFKESFDGTRNKRTVWTIPTKPYPEAHFATFPPGLIETPIKAGCPKEVCKECGVPREAIWEKSWDKPVEKANRIGNLLDWKQIGASRMNKGEYPTGVHYNVVGHTDCGCNAGFRPGVVLDPFGGSGTVGEFCRHNGYDAIIIELNEEYKRLIRGRTLANIPDLTLFKEYTRNEDEPDILPDTGVTSVTEEV